MELHKSFTTDQQSTSDGGDFYVVKARPYEMPPTRNRGATSVDPNATHVHWQQQPSTYVQPPPHHFHNVRSSNVSYVYPTSAAAAPSPSGGYVSHSYQTHSYVTSPDYDDTSSIPQSRTFRVLQSVMHDNDSVTGANGLPPPRSAALESMKRADNKQRVRVLMPAQYNSPMGMYSAHNVLETFTAQAESMLESRHRPTQTTSSDHEVYFIQDPLHQQQQQQQPVNSHRQVRYNTNNYSQSSNSSSQ